MRTSKMRPYRLLGGSSHWLSEGRGKVQNGGHREQNTQLCWWLDRRTTNQKSDWSWLVERKQIVEPCWCFSSGLG